MKEAKHLFDFDDILIEPAIITEIDSRQQVNPYYSGISLPLMTAPMDTVINQDNLKIFQDLGIRAVTPRTPNPSADILSFNHFSSYGMDDFERLFLKEKTVFNPEDVETYENFKIYVLIDVANGHMQKQMELAEKAKNYYGKHLVLMVGNVANPKTFEGYCKLDIDFVRIGIGAGAGCLTTENTAIGYGMGSLINECYNIKITDTYSTKIVADGGFKNYADIIKALALGADYVMLGSIFNKSLQSAGITTRDDGTTINQYSDEARLMFDSDIPLYKKFRGMSTKEVQREWGKEKLTTSEGVVRTHKVQYHLDKWVENFTDYLKSTMSYTNKKTLPEFIGKVNYNFISQNVINRFRK